MASPTVKGCAVNKHNTPFLFSLDEAHAMRMTRDDPIHRMAKSCEAVSKMEELEARTSIVHAAVSAVIIAKHMHRVAESLCIIR